MLHRDGLQVTFRLEHNFFTTYPPGSPNGNPAQEAYSGSKARRGREVTW